VVTTSVDNDNFNQIPANVSNIWDLLAAKGISFASYQENIPYTGFQGFQYLNPGSGANNYVASTIHRFCSMQREKQERMDVLKTCCFQNDLANNDLPQHIFITPTC